MESRPAEVAACLEELIADGVIPQGGIGVYPSQNFTHYDVRLSKARWTANHLIGSRLPNDIPPRET